MPRKSGALVLAEKRHELVPLSTVDEVMAELSPETSAALMRVANDVVNTLKARALQVGARDPAFGEKSALQLILTLYAQGLVWQGEGPV